MSISESSRAALVHVSSRSSPDGFDSSDLDKEHRHSIGHLSRAGYIKKTKNGPKKYHLTTEGKEYVKQQKLMEAS